MDKVQWIYACIFHHHAYNNWDTQSHNVNVALNQVELDSFVEQLDVFQNIIKTYEMLLHKENQYSALELKYELLHFMGSSLDAMETKK